MTCKCECTYNVIDGLCVCVCVCVCVCLCVRERERERETFIGLSKGWIDVNCLLVLLDSTVELLPCKIQRSYIYEAEFHLTMHTHLELLPWQ